MKQDAQFRRRLVIAAAAHLAATIALAALYSRWGSIAGIFGLLPVLFSAFGFGLRGGLASPLIQLALNNAIMQLVIVPAVPMDGSSAVGVVFFFVAGAVVGNQRELSRRLRDELALNERLRVREQETLAAIPDAMIRIDRDGQCQIQPTAESMPLDAALARIVGRAIPSDQLRTVNEAISQVRSRSMAPVVTLELPGSVCHEVRCLPTADPSLLLVVRDISEQRRLLRRATSAENLAALGTLAAGLAHEINNPLTYVIASISGLQQSLSACEANLKPDLDAALDGCWRIRDLVHDILDTTVSRRDAIEPIFVPEAVESALALVKTQTRHCATIRWKSEDVLYARAHRTKLMQVVVNLVANASQAFVDHRASANAISVRAYGEPQFVCIEVEDNGCGMNESTRLRALEPFFTTKQPGQGSGLGLFLCNSIVESMGGSLQIDSEEGRGTRVTVRLRASDEAPPASRVVTRTIEASPNVIPRLRILVIDDEPEIRRALRRLLGSRHTVSFSSNGAEALERFEVGERFDVILCDLLMPEMTGIELFAQLEQRFRDQSERTVFITGGATSEAANRFIEQNCARVLSKPFRPSEIEQTLRAFAQVS